jgi:hypothetical protein
MLWIFWNIPAFDQYFKKWLHVWKVNKINLIKVSDFYIKNKSEFLSFKIQTINFDNWNETNIYYTKAKILDMYGFIIWFKK